MTTRFTTKSDEQWVSDWSEKAPTEYMPVFRCIERRCEPLPLHAHKNRPYLVYAKEKLK